MINYRPGIETGGALTYQFDGTGYSSCIDDIKHTREFSLTFRFRSYWKDALLFFTHNPQYVSVTQNMGFGLFAYLLIISELAHKILFLF